MGKAQRGPFVNGGKCVDRGGFHFYCQNATSLRRVNGHRGFPKRRIGRADGTPIERKVKCLKGTYRAICKLLVGIRELAGGGIIIAGAFVA